MPALSVGVCFIGACTECRVCLLVPALSVGVCLLVPVLFDLTGFYTVLTFPF